MNIFKNKLPGAITGLTLATCMAASTTAYAEGGRITSIQAINNVFYEYWNITYQADSNGANHTCLVNGVSGTGIGTVAGVALIAMQNDSKFTTVDLNCVTWNGDSGMEISIYKP